MAVGWTVTADANMMNDIMEEPEKDTLLEAQPKPQIVSVMSAEANPANAGLQIDTERLVDELRQWGALGTK